MDLATIAGIVALGFGLYMLVVLPLAPQKFAKLAPMKLKYGQRLGYLMHFIAYVLLPIAMGTVLLTSTL